MIIMIIMIIIFYYFLIIIFIIIITAIRLGTANFLPKLLGNLSFSDLCDL